MSKHSTQKRLTGELKIEAVRQIIDRDYKGADMTEPLEVRVHSLYKWLKLHPDGCRQDVNEQGQVKQIRSLKAELKKAKDQ